MMTLIVDKDTAMPDSVLWEEVLRIQKSLRLQGFARSSDVALGLPPDVCQYYARKYFRDDVLKLDVQWDKPTQGRLRVRDVIEYERTSDGLELEQYTDDQKPPADKPVYVLEDQLFVHWIGLMLSFIPIEEQQQHGTMCCSFTRSFTGFVPHRRQDNEQFVIIYVAAREAAGGVTSLHPADNPDQTTVAAALEAGDYLIFRDRDFVHDVTPITPRFEGDRQHRDTIVSLIHYPRFATRSTMT